MACARAFVGIVGCVQRSFELCRGAFRDVQLHASGPTTAASLCGTCVCVCVCVCVCSVFADMCKVLFVNDTAHSAMFVRLPLARHPCCICIANVYFCPSPSTTPFCPQKIAEHGDKVTAITSTAQGRLRLHLASRQRLAQGLVHVMLGRGDQMGRTPVWYAIHTRAGGDVVLDLLRSGCSHVVTKASVGREGVGYCSKEEGEDTVHNTSIEGIFLFIYSEK